MTRLRWLAASAFVGVACVGIYGQAPAPGTGSPQQREQLAATIAREMPGFRVAALKDYVAVLRGLNVGETAWRADFNRDGRDDWAVVVIDDQARQYRVSYVIATEKGWHVEHLLERQWQETVPPGPIRTPMFFKWPGNPGISQRRYVTLARDQASFYTAAPAIEVWTGQKHDASDDDLEDIAYCSHTWYYERGALRQFGVCD
jgi:hypothetical protein